ncbi:MAG: ABC transporter substrate-binding protein [Thermodesulfobacteriota bacterium]|nr:ABC transporter substrate-binding protein [Thermodesulfobacteriota bacterium]
MKGVNRSICLLVIFFVLNLPCLVSGADYNITQSMDFTGPYAVIMKSVDAASRVVYTWWNETVGSKLGIKLHFKPYETRYDPSVVASLWPGILSGDKPIAHAGLGGPDLAALMKRLPRDKVPMMMSTAAAGFMWAPNQWIFLFRPTYTHEHAAFLKWYKNKFIKDRPLRFAVISSQAGPMYVDFVNGYKKFMEKADWIDFVSVEWVDMKPVSILSEMRRLSRKKLDIIAAGANTAHALSAIKAQKELGIHIPLLMASHSGIQMCALASGDMKLLEGHYDAYACDPAIDMNVPGARVYEEYREKLGIKNRWLLMGAQASAQAVLICRAVERAAAKVGADNITGEAMYKAMYEKPFTEEEMLGLTHRLEYTKESPFPQKGLKVRITTVKNGKQILATKKWMPVVDIPKW